MRGIMSQILRSALLHHESDLGPRSVVCHNDLSPRNTVFRDGRPIAFLD